MFTGIEASRFSAPLAELNRSKAAAKVGELAQKSGLFFSHFEYREALEVPEFWLPQARPDLGEQPGWHAGVLAESKYQNFRNDLRIASFHPGHQAKWTAHELCHGLVGFAWRPAAPTLFHALAARLAELLPVALFYFFDEIGLRRCPLHQFGGTLFAAQCPACEREALKGPLPDPGPSIRFAAEGQAFIQRELHAIAQSRRLGRLVHSPWASIDLASDGLAYAAILDARLSSPEFERYIALFHPAEHGHHQELEALEARILELTAALLGEAEAQPLPCKPGLWAAQDIGWRLIETAAQTEGEATHALDQLIQQLAESPDENGISTLINSYAALCDEFELPPPESLFAVGYPLPSGLGRSFRQIQAGLQSAFPLSMPLVQDPECFSDQIQNFVSTDPLERAPLARRFSRWHAQHQSGSLADAFTLEAALRLAPAPDLEALSLATPPENTRWRLDPGVALIPTTQATLAALELFQQPESTENDEANNADLWLVLRRNQQGELDLIPLPSAAAEWLKQAQDQPLEFATAPIEAALFEDLILSGILVPWSWPT